MNKFFNCMIALLLPSMVSCNGGKVKEVPEDLYGCPVPEEEPMPDDNTSEEEASATPGLYD